MMTAPTRGKKAQTASEDYSNPQVRKAATAAFLGSMLEYYDFFAYGSAAALVFPKLFFPSQDPAVALIASLATFGVGYLARPLGGVVLGHFGDKVGRKKVLIITLVIMGIASVGVGSLPTYAQIGLAAPALLVLCRLAQGFSAGGEAAGASSLTIEHAPRKRRGFFASFMVSGITAGIVAANLVFIPVAAMSEEDLLAWGWRIPFWGSVVVLIVAYIARKKLDETPVFKEISDKDETYKLPITILLRTHWADVLRVAGAALFAVFDTIVTVYAVAYATSPAVGMDRSTILWVVVISHVPAILGVIFAARLSDSIGRRPVWIAGALSSCVMVFVFFWAISQQNFWMMILSGMVISGITFSGMNGLWPVMFAEQFAAPVRFSGFALGHTTGLMLAAFAPTIAAAISGEGIDGWLPVAWFTAGCGLLCAIAGFFFRETYDVPLDHLGNPKMIGTPATLAESPCYLDAAVPSAVTEPEAR